MVNEEEGKKNGLRRRTLASESPGADCARKTKRKKAAISRSISDNNFPGAQRNIKNPPFFTCSFNGTLTAVAATPESLMMSWQKATPLMMQPFFISGGDSGWHWPRYQRKILFFFYPGRCKTSRGWRRLGRFTLPLTGLQAGFNSGRRKKNVRKKKTFRFGIFCSSRKRSILARTVPGRTEN